MLRKIEVFPGRRRQCQMCKAPIVFARTMRSETGAGGKLMPLDLSPNDEGNVAVRIVNGRGAMVARVLTKGEDHDHYTEYRAMPHFATCPETPTAKGKRLAEEAENYLRDLAEGTPSS
jgi:hypothetical protein